jgi:hypothetical protein
MDDWENDDWENDDWAPPDLTNAESIKKKELQRLVEEADQELTEDLFLNEKKESRPIAVEKPLPLKKIQKNNKSNDIINRNKELMLEQKKASENNKIKKAEKKRQMEVFGQSEIDEFTDRYLDLEDKYN